MPNAPQTPSATGASSTASPGRRTTRVPGLFYLLMGLPSVFNLQYMPAAFIVSGDPAATAQKITSGTLLYRIGILSGLVANIGFLVLAWILYDVFRHVDRRQARLLVLFVSVSVAIGILNELTHYAPLVMLSGAHFLSAFDRPQLEALSYASLRLHAEGLALNAAFWGLWLIPFGILVVRSGFLPRIIGYCLLTGAVSYLVLCVASIVFPASRVTVYNLMLPLFAIGELPILLWLLIKGVPVRSAEPQVAA